MGPDGAVNIVYRNELKNAEDPDALKAKFVDTYRSKFANPFKAAELGFVDEIIYPRHARQKVCAALDMLKDKRDQNPPKKHGNIPL